MNTLGEILDDFASWDSVRIADLARSGLQDYLVLDKGALTSGEGLASCARWFANHLVDPGIYRSKTPDYIEVFGDLISAIKASPLASRLSIESRVLASEIAPYVLAQAKALNSKRKRQQISFEDRTLLLDLAGRTPRCWLTGYEFKQEAIDRYSNVGQARVAPLPYYVDLLRPIGLKHRDLAIQIDHVHPFSLGGEDVIGNLRLSCGWANSMKGSCVSIFDAPTTVVRPRRNSSPVSSLPRPLWVVKLLGTISKCEYPGCRRVAKNSTLTVRPINPKGSLVPTNLKIVCEIHDEMKNELVLPSKEVAEIWAQAQK